MANGYSDGRTLIGFSRAWRHEAVNKAGSCAFRNMQNTEGWARSVSPARRWQTRFYNTSIVYYTEGNHRTGGEAQLVTSSQTVGYRFSTGIHQWINGYDKLYYYASWLVCTTVCQYCKNNNLMNFQHLRTQNDLSPMLYLDEHGELLTGWGGLNFFWWWFDLHFYKFIF